MRLFISLDSSEIRDFSNTVVTELRARRSESFSIRLSFLSGDAVVELPHGAIGRAVVKKLDAFSSAPIAWSQNWRRSGYGAGSHYSMRLNLFTEQMVDQFSSLSGELQSVALALQIQWEYPGVRRGASIPLTVVNDYIRFEDLDEPPVPVQSTPVS